MNRHVASTSGLTTVSSGCAARRSPPSSPRWLRPAGRLDKDALRPDGVDVDDVGESEDVGVEVVVGLGAHNALANFLFPGRCGISIGPLGGDCPGARARWVVSRPPLGRLYAKPPSRGGLLLTI